MTAGCRYQVVHKIQSTLFTALNRKNNTAYNLLPTVCCWLVTLPLIFVTTHKIMSNMFVITCLKKRDTVGRHLCGWFPCVFSWFRFDSVGVLLSMTRQLTRGWFDAPPQKYPPAHNLQASSLVAPTIALDVPAGHGIISRKAVPCSCI